MGRPSGTGELLLWIGSCKQAPDWASGRIPSERVWRTCAKQPGVPGRLSVKVKQGRTWLFVEQESIRNGRLPPSLSSRASHDARGQGVSDSETPWLCFVAPH